MRTLAAVVGTTLALLASITGCAASSDSAQTLSKPTVTPSVQGCLRLIDDEALAVWEKVLGPALNDLNALPSVPGLTPDGPADITGCSQDSGENFDLSGGRSWSAEDDGGPGGLVASERTGSAFMSIVNRLRALGWKVGRKTVELDSTTRANPDFDTISLERRFTKRTVTVTLQVSGLGVIADLRFRSAPSGCRSTS